MISAVKIKSLRRPLIFLLPVFLIFLGSLEIKAQEPPPRPVRIAATAQSLRFGAFYHGATGGTVTILPSSSRSATGDVVLLGLGFIYTSALFEVHANRGTVVAILNVPDVSLFGIPTGSMNLHIGSTNPSSPFVSTVPYSVVIQLYIGGILTVGNSAANPPGSYTGTFDITLVQE